MQQQKKCKIRGPCPEFYENFHLGTRSLIKSFKLDQQPE